MVRRCSFPRPGKLRLLRTVALSILCTGVTWSSSPAQSKVPGDVAVEKDHAAKMARGLEIFKQQVRPVLSQRCLKCHGGKDTESEFDLSDRQGLLRGGTSGPAVLVGNARDSLLYKLISHAKEPHMPHNAAKLKDDVITQIAAWIDSGAPYDEPLVAAKSLGPSWTQKTVPDEARRFWSFQPLRHTGPPQVKNETWCRTAVDRFILAKLEDAGIQPNLPVDKWQLIRRAYFDLTGLPPTPEEVETFTRDSAPDAYEKLLDKLLKSPHYGERWARHWLDVARFAESHGFEHDYDRPTAYHYRDFVIKALNDDLPYDTFVQWQLAGDEFEPDNILALTATGFLAAGVHSTQITKNEVEKHRYDEMDDMSATVGTAMLGLTIGCARCHDHKFDPIPQRDYYQFLSTFTTTVRSEVEINVDPEGYKRARAAFEEDHRTLKAALRRFEANQLSVRLGKWAGVLWSPERTAALLPWHRLLDPDWRKLHQEIQAHSKRAPKLPKALISSEGLPAVRLHTQGADFFNKTYFLNRGDPNQKDGVALQGFLQVLTSAPDKAKHWQVQPPQGWRTSYRRRALANWITDVDHGAGHLLARVIVNRLWQHHMGRGIVATPSDFGTRGEHPTHPELLDWLATELIKHDWHLKPIHKLIMSSAVYTQSSEINEAKASKDRANRLFWHRPRHRLEAEAVRDNLLAVSGLLDPRLFGPGTLDESSKRRSIYFTVKRSKILPMMQVFDAPDALVSLGERPTTTVAPQALMLMNNPNVRGYAKSFARRIAADGKTALEDAVKAGYMIALARGPTAEELADSVSFLKTQGESYMEASKLASNELAFADFCQALMCLNDFVYVD
jgi:cytochrome c553